jgi:hypothetical protein
MLITLYDISVKSTHCFIKTILSREFIVFPGPGKIPSGGYISFPAYILALIKKSMKHCFLITLALLGATVCLAQQGEVKDVFGFRITDYIVKLTDSSVLVQVDLSKGSVSILEKEAAILKGNFSNGDTVMIGSGRCALIKGSYYYFSIRPTKDRQPKKGDLLYTFAVYPATYKGQIYKLIKQDIYLQHVSGGAFYSFAFPAFSDKYQEESVVDSLVADIKYTAVEMLKMDNGQNMLITTGRFKGKKLFTAMHEIKNTDVTDFLDYMTGRPRNYAGNDWKISEVFATWMVAGTPTVLKD